LFKRRGGTRRNSAGRGLLAGGLEVASSNLGAPIAEKPRSNGAFSYPAANQTSDRDSAFEPIGDDLLDAFARRFDGDPPSKRSGVDVFGAAEPVSSCWRPRSFESERRSSFDYGVAALDSRGCDR
jgi:hypothetical protein